ncbi:hypothetical protein [Microbacterium tumbae]
MTFPQPFDETPAPEAAPTVHGAFDDGDVLYEEQVTPEHGVLGFTLRELIIVGVWLIAFVTSFFPVLSPLGGSVWQGIQWILPIGLPTTAVFLIVLRRFSPDGIRRVGSLGIDQFASVVFSVAVLSWAQFLWELVASSIAAGVGPVAWVPWVQFVAMLGLVAVSAFAFLIPGLREDFRGRLETLAHRNANPVRPVIPRPRAPKPETAAEPFPAPAEEPAPAPAALDIELSGEHSTDEIARLDLSEQIPLSAHASGGDVGTAPAVAEEEYVPGYARRSRHAAEESEADEEPIEVLGFEPDEAAEDVSTRAVDIDATNPRTSPSAQPFWALAPTERDVVDEQGQAIFRIGPNAWALVIEDRGGAYVVRHDDGRIGYLHDIADITKG